MPSVVGAVAIAVGIVALAVAGTVAPDGGAAVGSVRVALVQGGGPRGVSKEQVSPASVYEAQLAATDKVRSVRPSPAPGDLARRRGGPRPPPGRLPGGGAARPPGRRARLDARRRRHGAGVGHHVPQPDRGLGPPRARRGHLRESPPRALRRVRARPLLLLPFRRPVGRADRRRPRTRHGPDAHPRRSARPPGVVRGLLRRAQPCLGAGGGRAAGGAHQHVVVRHVPGAVAGDRGRGRPGRRDGPRCRAGRPHGLQRRGHLTGRRRGAQRPRAGDRCWWPTSRSVAA